MLLQALVMDITQSASMHMLLVADVMVLGVLVVLGAVLPEVLSELLHLLLCRKQSSVCKLTCNHISSCCHKCNKNLVTVSSLTIIGVVKAAPVLHTCTLYSKDSCGGRSVSAVICATKCT